MRETQTNLIYGVVIFLAYLCFFRTVAKNLGEKKKTLMK